MSLHLEDQNNKDLEASAASVVPVGAPKHFWMNVLLHSSFGIYSCFWFVGLIREIKSIDGEKRTPWMWFFVPLFVLAQLFALPKLVEALGKLETSHRINSAWNSFYTGLWGVAIVVVSIANALSSKIEFPAWAYFIIVFGWALLIALIQTRFDGIKHNLEGLSLVSYKGKPNRYSAWEWVSLCTLTLFTISVLLIIAWWEYSTSSAKIEELEQGYVYTDENELYQFRVEGEGWSIVEIGTVSDGSGELELVGPLTDMSFVVFKYDLDLSMDDVARFRVEDADEQMMSHECREHRTLAPTNDSVVSLNECTGLYFGDKSIQVSQFIWVDNRIFEFYGSMSSTKLTYEENEKVMKAMAKGFYPL